jgi:hypothetical protein
VIRRRCGNYSARYLSAQKCSKKIPVIDWPRRQTGNVRARFKCPARNVKPKFKCPAAGVLRKTWTGLYSDAKAFSIFSRTESAKGNLDTFFVIPVDVGIDYLDELLNSCRRPVPGIEQLRFQTSKEAFTCRVVR